MAATPASAGSMVKQRVFVDVPSSPYPHSHYSPINKMTHALKENAASSQPLFASTLKRKLLSSTHLSHDTVTLNLKKQRLPSSVPLTTTPQQSASNACPEFPNGFVYCHQCSRKRDALSSISCTAGNTKRGGKPCAVKFCGPCLKRKYNEDGNTLRAQGNSVYSYSFKCPKCRNICVCWRCRKSRASESARSPVVGTHPVVLPGPVSPISKAKVEVIISSPSTNRRPPNKEVERAKVSSMRPALQKKLRQATLPQALPSLKWTAVPTILDLREAEARFQIREFLLRFASVMEPPIPKTQLAELDGVGCIMRDDEVLAPWVSEACVRSIFLGLLGFLAGNSDGLFKQTIICAVRTLRSTGNNLNKVWGILADVRNTPGLEMALSFPDPLPAPASGTTYNTRSTRSEANETKPSINITHPAQLIPVVEALIESTLESQVVRDELEAGFKDGKEITRKVRECMREENEKWTAERKAFEPLQKEKLVAKKEQAKKKTPPELKLRRDIHNLHIRSLENALKLVTPGFAPRFAPLGTDRHGRTFWALSPGVYERKTALDYISSAVSGTNKVSKRKQRGHATTVTGDHSLMKEWSWFVAVWGKKTAPSSKEKDCDTDVELNDEDEEQWWGFYEPGEIRKMADWIRIDAGISLSSEESNSILGKLVNRLYETATLLDWRLNEDKYDDFNADAA